MPVPLVLLSCYELGHRPHGLAMPMAFLSEAEIPAIAVDLAVESFPDAAIANASLVGISTPMHTALRLAIPVYERVRLLNPHARVVFYGHYAYLNRDYLRSLGVDDILAGESEQALVELARQHMSAAPGDPTAKSPVLSKLKFPVIHGLTPPPAEYARLAIAQTKHVAGYTEASRGCLDRCAHCPIPPIYNGRFFVVDRSVVLKDIATQIEHGAQHITFGDPDFLNGPGHTFAVVRELHERFPTVTFDITAQITHLDRHRDRLVELSNLGCAFVTTAVESLSDRVLAKLRKRHTRSDFERVLSAATHANLPLRPTFVTFTPWTTRADLQELIDFIWQRDLLAHVAPVQLSVRLLVPPGSLLLADNPETFGPLEPSALSHRWTHPDPRMDTLQEQIAACVEQGKQSPIDTHIAVAKLIDAANAQPRQPRRRPTPRAVPQMTEDWFC